MTRLTLFAAALLLAALPAHAEKPNTGACPPGLAKKNPPCVPPGLAKTDAPAPARIPDTIVILDPSAWPDWCASRIVAAEGVIYRTDRRDGTVLDLIGPVSDWAWDWDTVDFAQCPPGLAKKNPPCVPPGQAKKYPSTPLVRGQSLPAGALVLLDPSACTRADLSPVIRQGDDFFHQLGGEDTAILTLSLLAAAMK